MSIPSATFPSWLIDWLNSESITLWGAADLRDFSTPPDENGQIFPRALSWALLRLGAKQEGIVRHERIMSDGRKRNSVRFSIIDDEWPAVRRFLEERLCTEEIDG